MLTKNDSIVHGLSMLTQLSCQPAYINLELNIPMAYCLLFHFSLNLKGKLNKKSKWHLKKLAVNCKYHKKTPKWLGGSRNDGVIFRILWNFWFSLQKDPKIKLRVHCSTALLVVLKRLVLGALLTDCLHFIVSKS